MLDLHDIRQNQDLINEIDWEMTPEKAVSLYLEWGNNWNHGIKMVKTKGDVCHYFVVYYWESGPEVHLVRRDTEGAEELAVIQLPQNLAHKFVQEWGGHKGVYALNRDIGQWLRRELGVADLVH